jgi:hypothetical protein
MVETLVDPKGMHEDKTEHLNSIPLVRGKSERRRSL